MTEAARKFCNQGQLDNAVRVYEMALGLTPPPGPLARTKLLKGFGVTKRLQASKEPDSEKRRKKLDEARTELQRALEEGEALFEAKQIVSRVLIAHIQRELGLVCRDLGLYDDAMKMLDAARL